VRDGARAIELAEAAQRSSRGSNPTFTATLAAAYAEAGRFPEAIETAKQALQLATAQNRPTLANRLQAQIASYQAGAPYATPAGRPQSRDSRRGHDGLGISRRCRESSRPAKNLPNLISVPSPLPSVFSAAIPSRASPSHHSQSSLQTKSASARATWSSSRRCSAVKSLRPRNTV